MRLLPIKPSPPVTKIFFIVFFTLIDRFSILQNLNGIEFK